MRVQVQVRLVPLPETPLYKAIWPHRAVGSSTGTRVPWMWVLLRLPQFGGAAGLQEPFGALIAAELLKF